MGTHDHGILHFDNINPDLIKHAIDRSKEHESQHKQDTIDRALKDLNTTRKDIENMRRSRHSSMRSRKHHGRHRRKHHRMHHRKSQSQMTRYSTKKLEHKMHRSRLYPFLDYKMFSHRLYKESNEINCYNTNISTGTQPDGQINRGQFSFTLTAGFFMQNEDIVEAKGKYRYFQINALKLHINIVRTDLMARPYTVTGATEGLEQVEDSRYEPRIFLWWDIYGFGVSPFAPGGTIIGMNQILAIPNVKELRMSGKTVEFQWHRPKTEYNSQVATAGLVPALNMANFVQGTDSAQQPAILYGYWPDWGDYEQGSTINNSAVFTIDIMGGCVCDLSVNQQYLVTT